MEKVIRIPWIDVCHILSVSQALQDMMVFLCHFFQGFITLRSCTTRTYHICYTFTYHISQDNQCAPHQVNDQYGYILFCLVSSNGYAHIFLGDPAMHYTKLVQPGGGGYFKWQRPDWFISKIVGTVSRGNFESMHANMHICTSHFVSPTFSNCYAVSYTTLLLNKYLCKLWE